MSKNTINFVSKTLKSIKSNTALRYMLVALIFVSLLSSFLYLDRRDTTVANAFELPADEGRDSSFGVDLQTDKTIVWGGVFTSFTAPSGGTNNLKNSANAKYVDMGGTTGGLIRINHSNQRILSVLRADDGVLDLEVNPTNNNIAMVTNKRLIMLSSDGVTKLWEKNLNSAIADVNFYTAEDRGVRVSVGRSGQVALLNNNRVRVFDQSGSEIGNFVPSGSNVNDVAMDSANNQVIVGGWSQKDGGGCSVLQVGFVRSYDFSGSLKWTAYDWTHAQAFGGNSSCADTRIYRVSMGKNQKLYIAGESAGGNTIFRYSSKNLSQNNNNVKTDAFDDAYNTASNHITYYTELDLSNGQSKPGQLILARLDSGRGNTIRPRAITADENGNVLLGGTAGARYPHRNDAKVDGVSIGAYSGEDGYVLGFTPDLKTRFVANSFNQPNTKNATRAVAMGYGVSAVVGTTSDGSIITKTKSGRTRPDAYLVSWDGQNGGGDRSNLKPTISMNYNGETSYNAFQTGTATEQSGGNSYYNYPNPGTLSSSSSTSSSVSVISSSRSSSTQSSTISSSISNSSSSFSSIASSNTVSSSTVSSISSSVSSNISSNSTSVSNSSRISSTNSSNLNSSFVSSNSSSNFSSRSQNSAQTSSQNSGFNSSTNSSNFNSSTSSWQSSMGSSYDGSSGYNSSYNYNSSSQNYSSTTSSSYWSPESSQSQNYDYAEGVIGKYKNYQFVYSNSGYNDIAKEAEVTISIGDKMEVDPNSFVEISQAGQNCISPSLINISQNPGWKYKLTYRPKSANQGNSCSGSSQKGDVFIKSQDKEYLIIRFRAKVRDGLGLKSGDELTPEVGINQGIAMEFRQKNISDSKVETSITKSNYQRIKVWQDNQSAGVYNSQCPIGTIRESSLPGNGYSPNCRRCDVPLGVGYSKALYKFNSYGCVTYQECENVGGYINEDNWCNQSAKIMGITRVFKYNPTTARWEYDTARSQTAWTEGFCYSDIMVIGTQNFNYPKEECRKAFNAANGGRVFVFKIVYEQPNNSGGVNQTMYTTYTNSLPGGGFRNWYNPNSGNVWASPITQTFNYAK